MEINPTTDPLRSEASNRYLTTGFTLIEVLAALVVFGILFVIVNQILAGVFRGTTKSELTNKVKQDAQGAMSTLERELRNSRSVDATSTQTRLVYVDKTGKNIAIFECLNVGNQNGQLRWTRINDSGQSETNTLNLNDDIVAACSFGFNSQEKSITINLTFEDKTSFTTPGLSPQEKARVSVETRVQLRN